MAKIITRIKVVFLFLFVSFFAVAQQSPTLALSIPYQNSLLYNRYLINPTFSFVGEKDRNISMFSGTQWSGFNDSPKVYQLNYSGRFSEDTGYGIGLYQQNIGVITSFGGIGNAAYYVPFQENMGLTLGANLVFYSSGIDMSRVDVENPDPYLMSLDRRSLFSFHPGINFTYRQFDIGAYAENLVDYDFNTNETVEGYSETTFSGHLMYTYLFAGSDVAFRTMGRIRSNHTFGFNSGISFWANAPKLGWVQTGFDSYYGLSLGVGVHLSKKLSAGFVYEKASRIGMQNLGGTYEFNLVFTLPSENEYLQSRRVSTDENNSEGSMVFQKTLKKNNQQNRNKVNDESEENELETGSESEEDFTTKGKNRIAEQEQLNEEMRLDVVKSDEMGNPKVENENVVSEKKVEKRVDPPRMSKIIVVNTEYGYYVIAGVFSKESNAQGLIEALDKKGLKAMSFVNTRNNLVYVYLKHYNTLQVALQAYYSNLDNTYFEDIWILEVSKA